MGTQKTYETPFHYWISFFPTAPLFGVHWRFESMMPGAAFFNPSAVAAEMTRAGAREAAKATEEAFESAAHAAESAVERTSEMVEAFEAQIEKAAHAFEMAAPTVEAVKADVVDAEIVADAPQRPATLFDAPPAVVDDLKLIRGVGPKLETMLHELGVYTFAQVAAFSQSDLDWIDAQLGMFKGRPQRDDWVGQAKALL
ncbi:MAG: hypothetical protein ACFCUS_14430 [Rubrimonas sp.]|uniref:hypothetical protein n=1 Tax=Rubrimonas sp. TaxID=2036015 RepID=UPI002FDDB958